jgi:cold shock CspA family protein
VVKSELSLHSSIQQTSEERVTKRLQLQVPHKEAELAVRDALSARRKLQDFARRQRGDVKTHEALSGKVSQLFPKAGYGFLETSDGRQIYFHQNSVLSGKFSALEIGTGVRLAEEGGDLWPQASTVQLMR